jgi:hypothetical protein
MSEKALDAGNPSNIGSVGTTAKTSASEDFFRYMLLKERLGASGKAIMEAKSEKDLIMEEILKKIVNVRESTAEWSELVSLTGSENRFAQAEKLADIAWEKRRAELVLNKYTGGSDELDRVYQSSQAKVGTFRSGGGGIFGGGGGGGAPASASVSAQAVSLATGGAL